ncbi:hypothetical protein G6F36_015107 [Rhizopus arrhizus]|nr:hypothetical protein G6F36_015107 [Rhizopus arrhizus]
MSALLVDDIGDVNTTEVGDVSTAGASSTIAIEEHNTGFEEQLKRLDPAKKWRLSTGECVDNCYFYLDYKANMIILNAKQKQKPSKELVLLLNQFNNSSVKKLRKALKANHTFNAEYDWVIFSNYSILREFESRNLECNRKEAWYQHHI